MILEPIKPDVLSVRLIPNVDPQLKQVMGLAPEHTSIGLITCSSDDALYTALDEGTKAAAVDVVYAKSFYAGSAHASGPFSGEVIGVFAGSDPDIVASGLAATVTYLETSAWFFTADQAGKLAFFPHVVRSTGRYLSALAQVPAGTPMAYLIAPPIEALLGLDAALKAARVELKVYYAPPSETNFAGGLLVGDVHEVEAAAAAFQATVLELAARPVDLGPHQAAELLSQRFGKTRPQKRSKGYQILASGLELDSKPDGYTHLFDNSSLVPKDHPVIRFRGQLDLLQARVIESAVACRQSGLDVIAADLEDVLAWLRSVMAAEVTGKPMPALQVGGLNAEELHAISHNTMKYLGVGWVLPSASMGPAVSSLNLLRATCREVELAAHTAFSQASHLTPTSANALLHGFNRLSNALYVLVCKAIALNS